MCKIKRVFDETIELADNAMLKVRPELFWEWDFEKNDELGFDVYKVTKGMNKKVWWKCSKCESDYDMTIPGKRRGRNCPYCVGQKINHTNSLASLNPQLAKQWHPTKNGQLTPHDVTCGKKLKVWWLGECGHEWETSVQIRAIQGCGCPYCSNNEILIGFNDMWSTNPEQAKILLNPEDGYKYTRSGTTKLDWKCNCCGETIKQKTVNQIHYRGLSCPICSDKIPFSEKFLYHLLKKYNINFTHDTPQEWSDKLRYDFYLPEYNWIIETHGGQHSGKGFESLGGRSLKEEQENDKYKYELAIKNGIEKYIVIDARESTISYLKSSILNSDLMKIVTEIDFEKIGELSSNSLIKDTCEIWNSGTRNIAKISSEMLLSRTTIRRYLERGREIGWCEYTPFRSIVQLSHTGELISEWENTPYAAKNLNIGEKNINSVLRKKSKTAGGFKWMYKEDYEKSMSSSNKHVS